MSLFQPLDVFGWHRIRDKYFWMTAFIIARNSIVREYQNSYLGMVWTVMLPLIQVVVFAIIMPMMMARPVADYALYLVVSFPLWAFISAALSQSCQSVLLQAETIKRCMVSSVVFPIADVFKHFYNYLVSFITMYGFMLLWRGGWDLHLLYVPLLLLPLLIAVMSMSIALAYLAPYLRDVGYAVQMVMTLMFWFTPVVYPLEIVPEPYHWLYWLNPFYLLMHPIQQSVLEQRFPDLAGIVAMLLVMMLALVVGALLYRLCRRDYVYYL